MRPEDRIAAARAIMDIPFFTVLMDEMEMTAVNQCVNADPKDDGTRAAYAGEVRAIRSLRRKLAFLVEEAKADVRDAPA